MFKVLGPLETNTPHPAPPKHTHARTHACIPQHVLARAYTHKRKKKNKWVNKTG